MSLNRKEKRISIPNAAHKDLVFRMSKKIAQLTKVVYYLNTKNEDTGVDMQNLVTKYEHEIAETVREGTAMIEELQNKISDFELQAEFQQNIIQVYSNSS